MSHTKREASTHSHSHTHNNGKVKQTSPSKSKPGRNVVLDWLVGAYVVFAGCLAKAAVSMEGTLDRRLDIDRQLRKHEKTTKGLPASGIARYDFAHVASNDPAEDEHQEAQLPVPSGYWSFFGLYDGHNGGTTSKWLAHNLIHAVAGALADLYSRLADPAHPTTDPAPPFAAIEHALKSTFAELDDDICNAPVPTALAAPSRTAALSLLGPALSGSCALLAFYDSHARLLRVALTGDSRAVLGRPRPAPQPGRSPSYDVYVLSTDHSGANTAEIARLEADHPGEGVCHSGRVLGLGVSRAFGDARYKWPRALQERLKSELPGGGGGALGRVPLPEVRTPPYLTAEPDVTEVAVQPGDFLILASDGLWECLTSEEAVGLVGLFREAQAREGGASRFGTREPVGGYAPGALPVGRGADGTVRYRQWGAEKRFVMTDGNAATHLLRNALGGADKELTAALLAMKTPRARKYRDDMTALVVFFADEDARGVNGHAHGRRRTKE